MKRIIARGREKDLLRVITKLQDAIGEAQGLYRNDRSQTSFERAENILIKAFDLCIETTGKYELSSFEESE